jgi:hypothetical protein
MAKHLCLHVQTIRRFANEGVLRACRTNDRNEILLEPISGPSPKAHPGKRFKDRRRYPQCASNPNPDPLLTRVCGPWLPCNCRR